MAFAKKIMMKHLLKIGISFLSSASIYAADLENKVDTSKIYHVKFSNERGEIGSVTLGSKKVETYSSTKTNKDHSLLVSGFSYSFERFISVKGKPSLRIKYSKTGKAKTSSDTKNLFTQSLQSQIFIVSDLKRNNSFKTFDGKTFRISVRVTDRTGRPLSQ